MTCRSKEYETAVASSGAILTHAAVLEIEPVDLDDAATLLMSAGPSAQDRWSFVIDHLRWRPDVPLARVFTSPLMISLARTVYVAPISDPRELLDFSDQATPRAPPARGVHSRCLPPCSPAPETPSTPALGRYPPEQARRWLTFLTRHLDALATRDLAWWQLVDTTPQATRRISVGLTAGLVFGFAGVLSGADVTDPTYCLEGGLVFSLVFGLATGLSYGVSQRPEPLRVDTQFQGTLVPLLRRFMLGLAIGVGVGLGVGLPYEGALAVGLAFGFALAAPVWLDIPAEVAQVASPGIVLRQDRTATLLFGLILALPLGLSGSLVAMLPAGLAFGVIGGLVFDPTDTAPHAILGLAYGVTFGLAVGGVGVLSRAWGAPMRSAGSGWPCAVTSRGD